MVPPDLTDLPLWFQDHLLDLTNRLKAEGPQKLIFHLGKDAGTVVLSAFNHQGTQLWRTESPDLKENCFLFQKLTETVALQLASEGFSIEVQTDW